MNESPLVAIQCLAYNHGPYIRECLDGFVMQKTAFPFIAIVHDDASTDNTANIIREYEKKYPDIIKPIYETENQYSKPDGALNRIMSQAVPEGVKYIALCEGDDYWTDPFKLQKQVDFITQNPSCGLVFTIARYFSQKDNRFTRYFGESIHTINDFINKGNTIPTLTVLYKKSIAEQYFTDIQPEKRNWLMGDLPMWLYFVHNSDIGFIPECTGVYRVLQNSASHYQSKSKQLQFQLNGLQIIKFFTEKYAIKDDVLDINLAWFKFEYLALVHDKSGIKNLHEQIKDFPNKYKSLKLIIIQLTYRFPYMFIEALQFYRKIKRCFKLSK